jgi:diguanylate cyclase (GGDEF)-like protein/PAS domain S-box-containing protein
MEFSIQNKIVGSFSIGLILLGIVAALSSGSIHQLNLVIQEVNRTHQTLEKLHELCAELKEIEIGQQEYLITGRQEYLEPYYSGILETQNDAKALLTILKDRPQTHEKLKTLDSLIHSKLSQLSATIQLRQSQGITVALKAVQSGQGKAHTDQITTIIQELMDDVQQQVQQKQLEALNGSHSVSHLFSHVGLLALGMTVFSLTAIRRDLAVRDRIEASLRQSEAELFQEKEWAQVTLHSIGDAVITTDALGHVLCFNPVAEALTGWLHQEAYGLPLVKVFNILHETTREPVENPVEKALKEGQVVGLANHTILISQDGREIPIEDSAAPIRDRQGNVIGAVMVFHDVTQTRALTKQLIWQANHDPLTELVNRRKFERCVEQALKSAQAQGHNHVLCYLDLDQFKIVNDTCGHGAGDKLLCQITALLQTQVRKTDTLARLGGDEFGVLLHQCSLSQALRVANEMREGIQGFQFFWQEQTFKIGASIGLINIDANSESFSDILSTADAACYTAKNKGRNRVHIFQTDDQELLQQRDEMQWATRITQALEEDRFCLYFQSIAAIASTEKNAEHYEVLLRLRDEEDRLIPPMAFIPAAERYGLMHLIDRWVIRTLFATQGEHYQNIWKRCQIQGGSCNALYAINLSGASINDDRFIEFLHEQFALYQIPPQLICFEITETLAIANLAKANQFIKELQQLGCHFALDDFGSGMCSFSYLKNLPVDYLKIDGEFIRNISDNPIDAAIVEAMTRISHLMGMKVIAEFVENDDILERIKVLGLDYAQGYGISKPHPLVQENPFQYMYSHHKKSRSSLNLEFR